MKALLAICTAFILTMGGALSIWIAFEIAGFFDPSVSPWIFLAVFSFEMIASAIYIYD